jgi:hypothetical protein
VRARGAQSTGPATGRQGLGVKMMGLRENEYITSCFPVLDDGEDEVSNA